MLGGEQPLYILHHEDGWHMLGNDSQVLSVEEVALIMLKSRHALHA